MPTAGREWLIDACGCDPERLRNEPLLRLLCTFIIIHLELNVVGEGLWHQFPPPGGLTGLYLLTESHLACHTYPEHGTATFNLYCCRDRPDWPWEEKLRLWLAATQVRVQSYERGVISPENMPLARCGKENT